MRSLRTAIRRVRRMPTERGTQPAASLTLRACQIGVVQKGGQVPLREALCGAVPNSGEARFRSGSSSGSGTDVCPLVALNRAVPKMESGTGGAPSGDGGEFCLDNEQSFRVKAVRLFPRLFLPEAVCGTARVHGPIPSRNRNRAILRSEPRCPYASWTLLAWSRGAFANSRQVPADNNDS